jgi:ADP-heptose:LPS heptosyltransferase
VSLEDKTIFVYGEQGLGDFIQFCRYVFCLKKQGANIILEVPKPLYRLLANLRSLCQIICEGDEIPQSFDYYCPILSLPLAFRSNLLSIPSINNALNISLDPAIRTFWQSKVMSNANPLIGLTWSGNAEHQNDHNRSILLSDILDYLPSHFNYICLQKEIRSSDQFILDSSPHLLNFSNEIQDFTDTAALISCLNCVITVDTSVAHLSGTLGVKTLLLLPYSPDWRWLLNRNDSPWYPSMRLYRQKEIGNWKGVLEQVSSDLSRLL